MSRTADWRAEVRDLCARRRDLERKAERVMPDESLLAAMAAGPVSTDDGPFGYRLDGPDRDEWRAIRAEIATIAGGLDEPAAVLEPTWRERFLLVAAGAGRRALYHEYLRSSEWKNRRARVLRRDDDLCQGCRCSVATEVHHLTYEHVGAEFLFELTSLCHACHEALSTTDSGCERSADPLDGLPPGVLAW